MSFEELSVDNATETIYLRDRFWTQRALESVFEEHEDSFAMISRLDSFFQEFRQAGDWSASITEAQEELVLDNLEAINTLISQNYDQTSQPLIHLHKFYQGILRNLKAEYKEIVEFDYNTIIRSQQPQARKENSHKLKILEQKINEYQIKTDEFLAKLQQLLDKYIASSSKSIDNSLRHILQSEFSDFEDYKAFAQGMNQIYSEYMTMVFWADQAQFNASDYSDFVNDNKRWRLSEDYYTEHRKLEDTLISMILANYHPKQKSWAVHAILWDKLFSNWKKGVSDIKYFAKQTNRSYINAYRNNPNNTTPYIREILPKIEQVFELLNGRKNHEITAIQRDKLNSLAQGFDPIQSLYINLRESFAVLLVDTILQLHHSWYSAHKAGISTDMRGTDMHITTPDHRTVDIDLKFSNHTHATTKSHYDHQDSKNIITLDKDFYALSFRIFVNWLFNIDSASIAKTESELKSQFEALMYEELIEWSLASYSSGLYHQLKPMIQSPVS